MEPMAQDPRVTKEMLRDKLFARLSEDLDDPDKCGPGLYGVVRGVINDNTADPDLLPADLSETAGVAPFKIGAG